MLYPYRLNLDWLWGTPPGNDGTPATVRAVLEGADACALAQAWLESLSADDNGHRGEGGWGAQLVLRGTLAPGHPSDHLCRRRRR